MLHVTFTDGTRYNQGALIEERIYFYSMFDILSRYDYYHYMKDTVNSGFLYTFELAALL